MVSLIRSRSKYSASDPGGVAAVVVEIQYQQLGVASGAVTFMAKRKRAAEGHWVYSQYWLSVQFQRCAFKRAQALVKRWTQPAGRGLLLLNTTQAEDLMGARQLTKDGAVPRSSASSRYRAQRGPATARFVKLSQLQAVDCRWGAS